MEEPPLLFLCPISMELMENPVTVSTGVTYDRRSIERWFFKYGKTTCPATMQRLSSFDLTPNHTLKSVISSWLDRASSSSSPSSSSSSSSTPPCKKLGRERLPSVLAGIEDTPFKVTALKNLRSCMEGDAAAQEDFVAAGGIQVLGRVMTQALAESTAGVDFSAFRTCEEAGSVLAALPLSDDASVELVLRPECMRPVVALVQRGSAEARLHAMAIVAKVSRASGADRDWAAGADVDDLVKSLLELLSDGAPPKLSSRALDVLLDVTARSRGGARRAARAVEVGAVRVLVELLPDADRRAAERALLLLKRLCRCPEGRLAFAEHALAVPAVARAVLRVSGLASRLAVGVLWLVAGAVAAPAERVLDDMVMSGAVAKLLALMQVEGSPSTKEKAAKLLRMHGAVWRQYPCFPTDLRDYLKFLN